MKSPNNEPNSKPAFSGLQQPMDGKKGGLGIAKLTRKFDSGNMTVRRIINSANLGKSSKLTNPFQLSPEIVFSHIRYHQIMSGKLKPPLRNQKLSNHLSQ